MKMQTRARKPANAYQPSKVSVRDVESGRPLRDNALQHRSISARAQFNASQGVVDQLVRRPISAAANQTEELEI
jgi:hypothetical protein